MTNKLTKIMAVVIITLAVLLVAVTPVFATAGLSWDGIQVDTKTSDTSDTAADISGIILGVVQEKGKEVEVIVKAMEVMLAKEKLNIGARNQIEGTVTEVKNGAVNAVVKVDAAGGVKVTSVITMESVNDLGIAVGKKVVAIIKSSSVMITVE